MSLTAQAPSSWSEAPSQHVGDIEGSAGRSIGSRSSGSSKRSAIDASLAVHAPSGWLHAPSQHANSNKGSAGRLIGTSKRFTANASSSRQQIYPGLNSIAEDDGFPPALHTSRPIRRDMHMHPVRSETAQPIPTNRRVTPQISQINRAPSTGRTYATQRPNIHRNSTHRTVYEDNIPTYYHDEPTLHHIGRSRDQPARRQMRVAEHEESGDDMNYVEERYSSEERNDYGAARYHPGDFNDWA